MRQQGKGSIVPVSARPAADPTAGLAAYGVSQAALSHLVRILDLELRPHGMRVNAIAPQRIDPAVNRAVFPSEGTVRRRMPVPQRQRDQGRAEDWPAGIASCG
jgi:NAD(P)-dependent dehydrogenase (short-subunit alcohol dehydrogenase family)